MQVWEFTVNNARTFYTSDATTYAGMPNVIIDPDLSAVKGLPPHHWKLDAGRVIPLTEAEILERDAHIAANGAVNTLVYTTPKKKFSLHPVFRYALIFALGALTMYLTRSL